MQIIQTLSEISANYDALFVDLWGCVHDGLTPFPSAVAALQAYRASGGTVVLVTNSPRPRTSVERHLAHIGVPGDAWDTIATSGDAARTAMYLGAVGTRVWFLGEPGDQDFLTPPSVLDDPAQIELVPLDAAEGIVCTGPFDPMADPADLRPKLLLAKQRGLKLLCANPDIVVDRGETREWCAGAVAALYTEMGGDSLYFGKPHPPIYDLALRRLAEIGKTPDRSRVLAIGDGILTDIRGAMGEDVDSLFITGGLAAAETATPADGQPDPQLLTRFVQDSQIWPSFAIGKLR